MEFIKFIDSERIIREKSPTLYKWLPKFVLRWLKRKLHEDELNAAMNRHLDKFGLEYNIAAISEFGIRPEIRHAENVPANGGVIIAANHPLGGLDGIALIYAVGQIRPDVRFLVNDILRNIKNYGDVFVGVNKVGATTRDALKVIEDVYASDAAVLVFPAGLVSRKQNGGIKDLEWNKSFVSKALKYNKPILPVFIEGKNSNFFYNFSMWRKRLGIKGNIEMLFLPDEMFKQKDQTIRIHFGKPFDASMLDNSKDQAQWAREIKSYVYSDAIKQGKTFEEFLKNN
ncbi:MAG: 1-acyl-sn-glycerol-3-phosphate acyltransferase [Bacteroidetes bacterium]|nr:1-acyl-sn-glycerol-3-phosphate acyltransferase [Bacteroidota bacterium]